MGTEILSSKKDAKALYKCHKVVHMTQSHETTNLSHYSLLIQCFEFHSMSQLVEFQPASYTKLYGFRIFQI